jgi:NTE family protein
MKFFKLLLICITTFVVGCAHRAEYPHIPKTILKAKELENIKVALVLGGGGAKGYVHLGVIEVLEKNKIPIDLIVGTSAGSIVGALYANNPNIDELRKTFFNLTKRDLIDLSFASSIYGVAQGWYLRDFLTRHLKDINIENLKIPFVAVATSLESGKTFVLNSGPVVPAVHASSALPPIFTPVYIYGQHLIDGGATEPVPVDTAKLFKPQLIIAVNISSRPLIVDSYDKVSLLGGYNALGISYRALMLAYYELSKLQTRLADISISPDVYAYGMFDDDKKEEMYAIGKKAAERALPAIKAKLKESNITIAKNTNKTI